MTNPHINPEKTYALVVGIEKYDAGSDWNLNGSANDAIQFANWLLNKGVKSENIYLFVSPLDKNRDLLNRTNIKSQPANQKNIYNKVTRKLLGENVVGELLYVFWGGHGYKVNSKNTRRILWYSDTDNENCKTLDIKSLTEALKTSFQNKGFATQRYFIDTCAISVGHEHDLILKWESSTDDFTPNGRESINEQFVLFASSEDEAAINDNNAGSGSFSSLVLDELKQLPEGRLLPDDMEELTKKVQEKVNEQSTQRPVYFWVRKLDGSEEEGENSSKKSSGATSTTLITTPLNLKNWVGREDEINLLQTWLMNTEVNTIGIQGFSGVGKSTLAAYLYDKTDKAGFEGKFWANVSNNTNFTVFAEKIITQFGGQVTQRGDITELVNDLLHCLNQRRYLLVVDNLETVLNKSRQWDDSAYEQFFESWLKYGCKSTLLLTTQEKPILFQPESWWYLLKGMKISDGVKLLRKFQIQGSSPEKEAAELEAFVNSVDGHPLILELVAEFLRAYCDNKLNGIQLLRLQQFQSVDNRQRPNWESPDKCLSWILEQHFQRLNQNQESFLFNLSVYRKPFSNEAARYMLTSNHRELQELFNRSLLLKTEDGKYHFQPFVGQYVRQVIHQQSRDLTLAHQKAFEYYSSHLKDLSSEKTLEDVTKYLEAFYHSCQLEQYAQAYHLLNHCYEFLEERGYNSIIVDTYEELVQKWPLVLKQQSKPNLIRLFTRIGVAYTYVNNSEQAIKYHQESLSIARELGDRLSEAGALCNLGHAYGLLDQKQDYHQAIKYYQQALPISREIGHREFEGNTLGGLGSFYSSLGEYQKAIEYYQQWRDIAQKIDDKPGEATALGGLGSIYEFLENYQRAIYFYKRKLKIAQSINNLRLQAVALRSLSDIYHYSLQDYQKAIEYYQQAVPIYQKIGDRSQHGGSLCNQGFAYYSLKKYEEAIKCYEEALPILREIGNREFEANTLDGLGETYISLGEYHEAIKYFQQCRDIAQEIDDKFKEADALDALVSAYKSLGKCEKVIECYERAVILYHEIGDRSMEGGSLCNLGNAYRYLKKYEEAIKCYEEALPILREIGHREFEANTLSGLGYAYNFQGEHQEAINCHQKQLRIRHKIGDRSGKIGSLWGLASAYQSLNEYQQAIKYSQQALKIARKIGDRIMEGGSLCNLGRVYISMREYQQAVNYCQEALPILRESGHLKFQYNTLYNLVSAYESLEEYDEAIQYNEQKMEIERFFSNRAREIGDRNGEGRALGNLDLAYDALGEYQYSSYYELILLNDDINTFGYVYECLMRYIPEMKTDYAWKLTNKVHYEGQAVVWGGSLQLVEQYGQLLRGAGLTVSFREVT